MPYKNKEDQKRWSKEYYQKNRDNILKKQKQSFGVCIKKML